MTQQNQAVTYTKAIGIILMVLAHCSHFPLLYQIVPQRYIEEYSRKLQYKIEAILYQ